MSQIFAPGWRSGNEKEMVSGAWGQGSLDPAELPLKPPPLHSKCGAKPQWCYVGDFKTGAMASLSSFKVQKFQTKTFQGQCGQVSMRTRSKLQKPLQVTTTPNLSGCDFLHCGHYNLDLQFRLKIVTILQSWYMSVLVACRHCLCCSVALCWFVFKVQPRYSTLCTNIGKTWILRDFKCKGTTN